MFTARDDGVAYNAPTRAINGGNTSVRFTNDLCYLFYRRDNCVVKIFVREGASIVLNRFVFLNLHYGLNRHLRNFRQVLTMYHFSARRRYVHTMMGDVNGVNRFDANEAQVVGRNVRRLNDGGRQFLYRGAFFSRRALGTKGSFLEGLGTRIAADRRSSINRFRCFVGVIRSFLVFSLNSGLGITTMYVRCLTSVRRVLLVAGGQVYCRVGILFGDVRCVIAILFYREERVSTRTQCVCALAIARDDFVLRLARRVLIYLLGRARLRVAVVGRGVTVRLRVVRGAKVECDGAFANHFLYEVTCGLRFIAGLVEGELTTHGDDDARFKPFYIRRCNGAIKGLACVNCRFFGAFAQYIDHVRASRVRANLRGVSCGLCLTALV